MLARSIEQEINPIQGKKAMTMFDRADTHMLIFP